MIHLSLGIIIGILLNPSKEKIIKIIHEYKEREENKGESKFFEPKDFNEKFKEAQSIEDLLDNNI